MRRPAHYPSSGNAARTVECRVRRATFFPGTIRWVTTAHPERFREIYQRWLAGTPAVMADLARDMAGVIREQQPGMHPADAMRAGWAHASLTSVANGDITDAALETAVRFLRDGMHPARAVEAARVVLSQ